MKPLEGSAVVVQSAKQTRAQKCVFFIINIILFLNNMLSAFRQSTVK